LAALPVVLAVFADALRADTAFAVALMGGGVMPTCAGVVPMR